MKKIIPYFWCHQNVEEFVKFYTEIFPDSRMGLKTHYSESSAKLSGKPVGSLMSCQFWLCGQEFVALNGGNHFSFSPAVSLTVPCENQEQIDRLWEKLSHEGKTLMPLQEYPFSKRYGWVQDRFGVSWQLNMSGEKQQIKPSLLFVGDQFGKAQAAAEDYARIFEGSQVLAMERFSEDGPDPKGNMMHAALKIGGVEIILMDGPGEHHFGFTGALSLLIDCENQAEIDHFWNALTQGGAEMPCGWLSDKYGVTWQVFANFLEDYLYDKNEKKSEAATQAMLSMKKIFIDEIIQAHANS